MYSNKPVSGIQRCLDFPVNELSLIRLGSTQDDSGACSGDVLLPNLTHHILGIRGAHWVAQRSVDNLIALPQKPHELIFCPLVVVMMITDKDTAPFRNPKQRIQQAIRHNLAARGLAGSEQFNQ